MDHKCSNCKYYWNESCHNKELQRMLGVNIQDEFIYITEEGHLSEYLKEHDSKAYELANMVLERLKELEYIKKNKKEINNYREIDEYENFIMEFSEIMDDAISSFIIPKLKQVNMSFEVDSEFGCRFWE